MDKVLIKVDRNGSKHYEGDVECPRCGGAGIFYTGVHNGVLRPAQPDDGMCYKCFGAGFVHGKWIERTPEYQAKLDAKRAEKHAAQQAQYEAERKEREMLLAEQRAKEAEEKRKAEEAERARKAISKHYGSVGDKLKDAVLTYKGSAHWEQRAYCGYGTETMFAHRFVDDAGNVLVWKTGKAIGWQDAEGYWVRPEDGSKIIVSGTIKAHGEYKQEKQTELTRCKVRRCE